jgi:hypothetical protein
MQTSLALVDPTLLNAGQWQQLAHILNDLYVATGLGITAAMSFLLSYAIIPSLVASGDVPEGLRGFRWAFYPIFVTALGLTCFALARAFSQGVGFLDDFYPRFGY